MTASAYAGAHQVVCYYIIRYRVKEKGSMVCRRQCEGEQYVLKKKKNNIFLSYEIKKKKKIKKFITKQILFIKN